MCGELGGLVLGYHWGLLWGSVLYRWVVSLGIPGFSIALWSQGFILGALVSRVNLSGAPGRLKG